MNSMHVCRHTIFLLGLLAAALLPAYPQATTRSLVDWDNAHITVEINTAIPEGTATRPAARHQARTDAEHSLPGVLTESILGLRVDSTDTIRTLPEQNRLLADSDRIYQSRDPEYSRVSDDFSRLQLRWQFPLYPAVAELLLQHTRARPIPRRLGWTPRAEYTGIVIYARHVDVQGALFPRILDSRGRVIFDRNMQSAEDILHNGMLAYSADSSTAELAERVGSTPRRVTARAASGTSDIILAEHDVHALLSTPSTREALQKGRIVIQIAETEETIRY